MTEMGEQRDNMRRVPVIFLTSTLVTVLAARYECEN